MPQALQKCSARIVPHDQHVDVASPGMISEEPDLDSGFAIDKFTTSALQSRRRIPSPGASKWRRGVKNPWDYLRRLEDKIVRRHIYAVNELPQPHDLVEFGFTKTKPCCIRVSW